MQGTPSKKSQLSHTSSPGNKNVAQIMLDHFDIPAPTADRTMDDATAMRAESAWVQAGDNSRRRSIYNCLNGPYGVPNRVRWWNGGGGMGGRLIV